MLHTLPFAAGQAMVLFVTDPGIRTLGLAAQAVEHLKQSGFGVIIYDRVQAGPKASNVLQVIDLALFNNVACVVSFGGGRSMDIPQLASNVDRTRPLVNNLDLSRFSSGFFRTMFAMKKIQNGTELHGRVLP